jgi:PAS domain S-box-containing protein
MIDTEKLREELLLELEHLRKENEVLKIAYQTDITEKRQAEEALKESEEKHRSLFEISLQGIVYYNFIGFIINANPAAQEILGLTPDQMRGRSSVDPRWKAIKEDGSEFPGEEHPAILSLNTGTVIKNTVMGVFNPNNENYRWININTTPLFKEGEVRPYMVYSIFDDITEQKLAKEELAKEKQRLSLIIQGINIGTWEWNILTGETIFNERWAEIIGYTLEEISPVNINKWMKFVHPDDLKISGELLEKHFNGELEYYECEARMKHKNGNWIWVLDRGKVHQWDKDGKPLLMSGTHKDITTRKMNERIILSFVEKYKTLLETSRDGIHLLDINGNLIECNNTFCQMLGYEKDEILNLNIVEWDAQIPIENIVEVMDEVFLKPSLFETSHRKKNGEIISVEINASGVEIDGKNYIYASSRNITERKRTENALKKSETKYRQLFDNMIEGFSLQEAIIDENGNPVDFRFIEANRNYKDFTGFEAKDIKGKTIRELIPDADINMIKKYCQTAVSGEPFVMDYYSKTFNKFIKVNCYSPEKGYFATIFEDITDRKKVEEEQK